MKLIAEYDSETGRFYVYRETEVTYQHSEVGRRNDLTLKTLTECDEDCQLDREQYVVVDITPVRGKRKKVKR